MYMRSPMSSSEHCQCFGLPGKSHLRCALRKWMCSDINLRWRCMPRKKSPESIVDFSPLRHSHLLRCTVFSCYNDNENHDPVPLLLCLARLLISPGSVSTPIRVSRNSALYSAPVHSGLNATAYIVLYPALYLKFWCTLVSKA